MDNLLLCSSGVPDIACDGGAFLEDYEDACDRTSCPSHPDACCIVNICSEVVTPNGVYSSVEDCGALYYDSEGNLIEECSDLVDDFGLVGVEWTLVEFESNGTAVEVAPGPSGLPTLSLTHGERTFGTTGCNSFFSSYRIDAEA